MRPSLTFSHLLSPSLTFSHLGSHSDVSPALQLHVLLAGALDYHEEDGAAAGSAEQRPSAYAHAKGLTREDVTARLKSDDVIDALIDAVCHGLTDLQTPAQDASCLTTFSAPFAASPTRVAWRKAKV